MANYVPQTVIKYALKITLKLLLFVSLTNSQLGVHKSGIQTFTINIYFVLIIY